ncbi:MAG TPA: choice-of-anchor tandem repeat GloVer-containing protein [Terriglobales bacterium]
MTLTWLGITVVLCLVSLAYGVVEKTIYAFATPGSGDGMFPYSRLVFDANGNCYGTTQLGGPYNSGIIFELSPDIHGVVTEKVLYEFTGQIDGGTPYAGLVFDKSGNLYGAGAYGGANGSGVIFELAPQAGRWNHKVIYNFGNAQSGDGFGPNSRLVFDKQGNLFGTTLEGGPAGCFQGCGIVFELSPNGDGSWREQVLHTFLNDGIDGALPSGGVTFDGNGNLYGTTQNGGTSGSGVLYQLRYSPSENQWIETILHQFLVGSADGAFPESEVLIHRGHLFGTTEGGGTYGYGTVFETVYSAKSGWETNVIHSFGESPNDGHGSQAAVTMDNNGTLYGVTSFGGAYGDNGTAFRMDRLPGGTWTETVLHSFNGADGSEPRAALAIHGGWLYGTSPGGGNDSGLVYQVRTH